MDNSKWIACPSCNGKLIKVRDDTLIRNFPAYCKHCKKENLINIEPKSRVMK